MGRGIAFCLALIEAGVPVVEPGAFVSPKWVPQMSGSEDVFKALPKDRTQLPMLVPNKQGYERAKGAGVNAIAIFTAPITFLPYYVFTLIFATRVTRLPMRYLPLLPFAFAAHHATYFAGIVWGWARAKLR